MNDETLFEKREVYVHELPKDQSSDELASIKKVGGRLQVAKNKCGVFIRFLPYGIDPPGTEDWMFVLEDPKYTKDDQLESVNLQAKANSKYKLEFNIAELSSIRRTHLSQSFAALEFMLIDGHRWPKLHFHQGGSKDFLQELHRYSVLKRDKADPQLLVVQREDGQAFAQSLYELSLYNEQRNDVVKNFVNQPVQSTLMSLSKVTNLFRGLKSDQSSSPSNKKNSSSFYMGTNVQSGSDLSKMTRYSRKDDSDDMSELMDSMTSENIHLTNNDGFEMVTRVDLGPMPEVKRGPPVSTSQIVFDKDGRVLNSNELKQLIFRGGIENSSRADLWKFLLNYYDWNSTAQSRQEARKIKVDDYYRMKLQWMSMSEDQKKRSSILRERESLIDKDVARTDRTHENFIGDDNINLTVMREILMTYIMYNFDLGYVQGMSDLLAPLMVIMNNEVDAFYCFVGFMDIVGDNFNMDQIPMKTQLNNVKTILEFVDSRFSNYLEEKESSNMYFCFRWLLILFKREFEFPQINRLWEIFWTGLPCKNFQLLITVAILLMHKDDMMTNQYSLCEILKFVNELSMNIKLEEVLNYAEGLYIQLTNFKNLPKTICEIFGFPTDSKSDGNANGVSKKSDVLSSTSSVMASTSRLQRDERRDSSSASSSSRADNSADNINTKTDQRSNPSLLNETNDV